MSAAEIEFRDYRQEDRGIILALLSKEPPPNYPSQKEAVFDWQFLGNPESGDRSPFVVETVLGEIVAVDGLLPVRVRFGGEAVSASFSVDTFVSADYRGRGFGEALIARASSCAPVRLGFGIGDML